MDQVTSEHAVDLAAPARVGREQQLYKDGVRQSAGCIPVKYEENRVWVLMVQSTKKDDWILPKGGWETDETQEQAAIRETYEESGAVGDLGVFLGCYQASITKPTKIDIYFYLMRVTQLLESWPEGQCRGRKWFPLEEALESSTRPEICNVLQHLHKLIDTDPSVLGFIQKSN
eukprot:TRINITY_DN1821_c0_g1_i1.p1 TRINITY_DN1821_c0_g1~~TRINITY_DN1821_c0_g1_i1.p1  ORF type:complete len:173 (-),score=32.93 TRINITY_DN1821_c0_g1_i1:428-946(-)